MAAGDLENIRPTSPDGGIPAARTRNIWLCDTAGTLHSVKAVYWSPTNNAEDLKLIWLRDHAGKKLVIDQNWQENKIRKFTVSSDMEIKAIRTLTDRTQGAYAQKYACIIDVETGLTVGYCSSESTTYSTTTKYSFEGYYVTWTFDNTVYLKANKEYYICCHYGSNDSGKRPFAYFENEIVAVKDAPNELDDTTQRDLRNLSFGGVISGNSASKNIIDKIMSGNANVMYLNTCTVNDGNVFNTSAIQQYRVYAKNSAYSANAWSGIVPADQNKENGKGPTLETLAAMSSGDMALTDKQTWDQNPGGIVFRRTSAEVTIPDAGSVALTTANIRSFILENLQFSGDVSSHTFINTQYFNAYGNKYTGEISANTLYKATSANFDASDLATDYTSPPENPVNNRLYWKAAQWNGNIYVNWDYNCIVQYKDGTWNNNVTAWFTAQDSTGYDADFDKINDAYTRIGTCNSAIMNEQETQGKKYYFEVIKTNDDAVEV